MTTQQLRPYYSYDKLYSFNAIYNYVIGGRGLGKTYGAKKKAIADAIKHGHEFIYLRRYKDEIKTSKATFFSDIEHEFPDYLFKIVGEEGFYLPKNAYTEGKPKWIKIGYFFALSTAQNRKSVSYPKVRKIIYDEFIIEKGMVQYLPNEPTAFNNFYNTVDRFNDRVIVLFLANSVSMKNPYFIQYRIRPSSDEFIRLSKVVDGAGNQRYYMLVHFPRAEDFQASVRRSLFGQMIAGTDYEDYAIGNQFADNHDLLLETKGPKARYMYTLECPLGYASVWFDPSNRKYYMQEKRPRDEKLFTLIAEKMDENKVFIGYSDDPMQRVRNAWRNDRARFDSAITRNVMLEVFKR